MYLKSDCLQERFCKFNPSTIGANMTDYVELPTGDEDALMEAATAIGPISVGLEAHSDFQLYESGKK